MVFKSNLRRPMNTPMKVLSAKLLTLFTVCSAPAHAQLEEIVVTAQKRAESIQDVPIAVSAFSEKGLEEIKAIEVADIAIRTPNFKITQSNIGEPQYNIRGVGSTSDSAGSDPTVPVFIDEVYIARPAASNFDFFDLERVEVLRGPQGTLFGRNTTGGAVSFTTKKPDLTEDYGKAQIVVGNEGLTEIRLVGNIPVSDTLAVKGSFAKRDRDGFASTATTNEEIDEVDNVSGRLQALYQPSDVASWLFSADFAEDDNGGSARIEVLESGSPLTGLVPSSDDSIRSSDSFNPDTFQQRQTFGGLIRGDINTSFGELTTITSYRNTDLDTLESTTFGIIIPQNLNSVDEDSDQFSQEFRLASDPDAAVQWIAGLYYFEEDIDRSETFDTIFLSVFGGNPGDLGNVTFIQEAENRSVAVFGQATFDLTESLALTAGLRYTDDDKEIRQVAIDNFEGTAFAGGTPLGVNAATGLPNPGFDVDADESFDALTGKISLEYTLGNGDLLYGSYNRGFKSGFFASQANSAVVAATPLAEEIADSFEIGYRGDFLDNRLRVNATAFYVDYTDLQQFALDSNVALITFNVDADIVGAELEITAAPTDWLEIGFSGSLLDTDVSSSDLVDGEDINGNDLPAPDTSFNVFAAASFEALGGSIQTRANYFYTDDFFVDTRNVDGSLTESYDLIDARVSYVPLSNDKLEIAIWGKNLSDEEFQSHVIPFAGAQASLFGAPRTYGISATYEF